MPNHLTLTFCCCERRDVSCSHSNRDLFTCEDSMLFSHVKISCFRAKAHLVFHWYLYNKVHYFVLSCWYFIGIYIIKYIILYCLADLANFALQEQPEDNLMVAYNFLGMV